MIDDLLHPAALAVAAIKRRATELGFDHCGIAPAGPSVHADYVRQWLADGHHGEMRYLADRADERLDLAAYFPGVRSVVCVAMHYKTADPPPAARPVGRVARYAWGDDYHVHIKDRLFDLADWLRDTHPGCRTKIGVDTVPVLEKELAVRAGVGWMGKNTCVIHPRRGSWMLLAEVLTTLDLPPDAPVVDRCGTCTRCIDACPTGAIVGPYRLDARKCISYLTIEHAGPIAADLAAGTGDWIFGCDVCQEVCPYNRAAPETSDPAFTPRVRGGLDLDTLLHGDDDALRGLVRHSALKRVKLPILRRNARIVAANKRLPDAIEL